jgi:geranylgeranyl diphosphate synthase type I
VNARPDAEEILQRCRALVDPEIIRALDARPDMLLYRMLRYHLGCEPRPDGSPASLAGKRVRAALCLLACQAAGGEIESAVPAAVGIELLHSFTLLHDDIADRDEIRRGRPTVWRVWGVGQAITAGDAMYAMANLAATGLSRTDLPPAIASTVLRELSEAALAVCEGQQLDLAYEGKADITVDDYLGMTTLKTAALFSAATGIGARIAGASEEIVQAVRSFGRDLGVAYQIRDDLLGLWGDATTLGKPVGSDLRRNKRTLPIVHALSSADPAHRQELAARLSGGVSEEEAAALAAEIEAVGSRAFCDKRAGDALARALTQLDTPGLRGGPAADLRALAAHLAERTA